MGHVAIGAAGMLAMRALLVLGKDSGVTLFALSPGTDGRHRRDGAMSPWYGRIRTRFARASLLHTSPDRCRGELLY